MSQSVGATKPSPAQHSRGTTTAWTTLQSCNSLDSLTRSRRSAHQSICEQIVTTLHAKSRHVPPLVMGRPMMYSIFTMCTDFLMRRLKSDKLNERSIMITSSAYSRQSHLLTTSPILQLHSPNHGFVTLFSLLRLSPSSDKQVSPSKNATKYH